MAEGEREVKVVSFGAGVNSTAILALVKLGELDLGDHLIVFADTGAERPSTYCHIREMQKEMDIQIVKNPIPLYDFCLKNHVIPSRLHRWCTDRWKVQPMRHSIEATVGTGYNYVIGFDATEERRVLRSRARNDDAEFPLYDLGITRKACKRLILKAGWGVPEKSGCYFCPFQRKIEWMGLKENQPSLFQKAVELEHNAHSRYAGMFLYGDTPLDETLSDESAQQRLTPLDSYLKGCLCEL